MKWVQQESLSAPHTGNSKRQPRQYSTYEDHFADIDCLRISSAIRKGICCTFNIGVLNKLPSIKISIVVGYCHAVPVLHLLVLHDCFFFVFIISNIAPKRFMA